MMTKAMLVVLADPTAHDSLKTAIRAFAGCDIADAENDALYLASLLTDQVDGVTARHKAMMARRTGRMMATLNQS